MSPDLMGVLHLARSRCHSPTALYATENGRGGNNHHALPLRLGCVSRIVHSQLDLEVLGRGLFRPHCSHRRYNPDCFILGLFLDLLHQVRLSIPPTNNADITSLGCCKARNSTFQYSNAKSGRVDIAQYSLRFFDAQLHKNFA